MPQSSFSHPFDVEGNPIDASFSLEASEDGFVMFYASRGGTKGTPAARNIEYHVGLTVLLGRLKSLGATVTDLLLDSAAARQRPDDERRLNLGDGFRYPIDLSTIDDPDAFRRLISDAQKDVLAAPGRNSKHGNRMRSIRMSLRLAQVHASMDVEDLVQHLSRGEAVLPTTDLAELTRRVSRIRRRGLISKPKGNQSPSAVDGPMGRRYMRLPAVVAYVLERANGRCELCGEPAFFMDSGDAYLEVHHVVQLAKGGPDTPENAVGVCANCHRELHFGVNRHRLVCLLYARVAELRAS